MYGNIGVKDDQDERGDMMSLQAGSRGELRDPLTNEEVGPVLPDQSPAMETCRKILR